MLLLALQALPVWSLEAPLQIIDSMGRASPQKYNTRAAQATHDLPEVIAVVTAKLQYLNCGAALQELQGLLPNLLVSMYSSRDILKAARPGSKMHRSV